MVQILLIFVVLFIENLEADNLFCRTPSGSEPSLFVGIYLFILGFKPVQAGFNMTLLNGLMRLIVL